ncbi:site-specific integrase [Streptomyces olivaceus]|uniref:tyrosine-type recombinase/integrase n=1 Tax=Streptomyces olivaceus TaxID=47716 RepID=UPI001CCA95C1|nr:tyrosine-type recombinase/integrase [Streptomyces olivaceus]MBZ6252175.1 site-specific integrase [Streptomyces olivaceus]
MPEIKKLPPNRKGQIRYRAVVDIGRDPATGGRKQVTVTRPTAKAVKAEINRLAHQRDAGTLVAPSKITLGEWLDAWLERRAPDVEASTLRGYRNALVHARSRLGHLALQDITEEHVIDFAAWLLTGARRRGGTPGTGLRASSAGGALQRLREALEYATVRRMINANPARFVHLPKMAVNADRDAHPPVLPWGETEIRAFLAGTRGDRLFAPFLLTMMGLRPAEVAGLRWDDIDLDAGTLAILNTRTMIGNAVTLEKKPKTQASRRTLPLPDPVRNALMAFQLTQSTEQHDAGEAYTPSPYMFVDELGEPLTTRQLRYQTYKAADRLGLRRVRLYDARAACLTLLAVAGVPDIVIAAWAGHAAVEVTRKHYLKPGVEALRQHSGPLAEVFSFEM